MNSNENAAPTVQIGEANFDREARNATQPVLVEVRNQLYRHMHYLSLSFHNKPRTGDLISRLISYVGMLQGLVVPMRVKAIAIQADAADADAVKAAVEKAVATFGRLDVLVNSAGTAIPKPFEETTLEEMDRVIDINIRGVFVATQAALKHMHEGGRIISIGSAVGERVAAPGLVPYAGTKGAVKMFTQALAREIGSRGITVNNVQPGPIDTELNPATGDWAVPQKAATALNRYGRVDEIAAMVAFVAGPEASYVTGANLTVDGGMNA